METLRILMLEDNENDMELIRSEIESSLNYHLVIKWVIQKADFIKALGEFRPDFVLSDYNLPQLNGIEALKLSLDIDPNVPFIIVTGTLTEEAAADSIKSGAWDYVVKERLNRLPLAIESSLRLKAERQKTHQAEAELKLIKEKTGIQIKLLLQAIEEAPSSVFLTDQFGTIQYVNPKFEQVTGYSSSEVIGHKPSMVLNSGNQGKNFYEEMWRTILLGNEWRGELVNRKKNGEQFWAQVSISSITDDDGKIVNFVAIEHDITEQKLMETKLKSSEEKFRLISNSAHDGIFMLNNENKIIYWNPAIEKIFEYPGEKLNNININQLLKSPAQSQQNDQPIDISGSKQAFETSGHALEYEVIQRCGSIIQIELSLAPLKIADQWGAVGIVRDITERKNFEKELILAKEQAEESDRLKSAFLATMSHELRTPLNAVIGFSSLIDETMELPEILEMVKIINDSGNHLLSIIDSVFSLALLQAGVSKVYLEDFQLASFLTGLKPYIVAKLKDKKEHLELFANTNDENAELILRSDKTKLTQLMINFFDNAIKYTQSGAIEYGCTVEGTSITFYVKDSGIGIPTDKQTIIFERFRQVEDSLTRKHGGVGLGLSICKEISDLLGGKIWVESEVNKGSTFYFKIDGVATNEI